MATVWVMIWLYGAVPNADVRPLEFPSKEACEHAKAQIYVPWGSFNYPICAELLVKS